MRNVTGEREKLRLGRVISTRSSDKYCFRFALTVRFPKSNRRVSPPSESMDWTTSLGSKEVCRTMEVDEA